MSTVKSLLFLGLLFMIGCNNDSTQPKGLSASHTDIYLELVQIEYQLLSQNYDLALEHTQYLDDLLRENYNLFCSAQSAQIDGARMSNAILANNIRNKSTANLLDDLRIVKATIIQLDTDEDYDPYFAFLWQFEEDMYLATETAIDPMLDLYEWSEFEAMVYCMNQSWQPLRLHYPSPELLNQDTYKYKKQTTYKIYLEKAVNDFNRAVDQMDYKNQPICDSALALREAYKSYLYSFIGYQNNPEYFLAKL